MKPVLILSLLLVCNLFAGGPIVLVDNETITSDTTYKIPLVPYDGSFNTLRVVIKANSNKPEGSERITNHPLKIGSIT